MDEDILNEVGSKKFDFLEVAFERLKAPLHEGMTFKEFYRRTGMLFSLPKRQARNLLHAMRSRYQNIHVIKRGFIWMK